MVKTSIMDSLAHKKTFYCIVDRTRLICSDTHLACDIPLALQIRVSLAASTGSSLTVIALRGVVLGLRPAPCLMPPCLVSMLIGWFVGFYEVSRD